MHTKGWDYKTDVPWPEPVEQASCFSLLMFVGVVAYLQGGVFKPSRRNGVDVSGVKL